MADLRQAAQAFLDAVEDSGHKSDVIAAADALRAALAQAEPVQQRDESLAQRLRAKGYEAEESGSAVENIKEAK